MRKPIELGNIVERRAFPAEPGIVEEIQPNGCVDVRWLGEPNYRSRLRPENLRVIGERES